MATITVGVKIKQALGDSGYSVALPVVAAGGSAVSLATLTSTMATLSTDIATAITNAGTNAGTLGLTTVNTDLTAANAALTAAAAAAAVVATNYGSDVAIQVNTTNAESMNKVKAGVRASLDLLKSGVGGITQ